MSNAKQHTVYLAVPGKHFCWGTTTGVVNCTSRHIARPFNGGMGFSGVEDFNILWADAHNLYEKGEITHFAMLHGDITPDPAQRWLDILLEELDGRRAALVSAVSPLKDGRGLTSSGIADLDDPWIPFRRFTLREIWEDLPETFDAAAAGYPDRPLLHNTGLWVCDMSHPVFHAANDLGELALRFRFPDRSIRGADGQWMHQRESEDWLFSRELWERGVRNTFVTRRVHLTHHGKMDFQNHYAWGSFVDGDENTAHKWRAAADKLPLRLLQMLEFELGTACNLAGEHAACPNRSPERFARLDATRDLDDETIVAAAARAYNDLGFTGLVGWIYYNEPLLQADRMFRLMARIKTAAPAARFILWTNGTLIPEACEAYRRFEQIVISGYNAESRRGMERLAAKNIPSRYCDNPALDDRLVQLDVPDPSAACLRPHVELIVDAHGNTHLCCYDWRGESTWGNVLDEDFGILAQRWRETLPKIAGRQMTGDAPIACRRCGRRWDRYQQHDAAIVDRCRRWRGQLPAAD